MRTRLVALVVSTPDDAAVPFDRRRDLAEHIDYARDLGAEVVTVEGDDLVSAIVEVPWALI